MLDALTKPAKKKRRQAATGGIKYLTPQVAEGDRAVGPVGEGRPDALGHPGGPVGGEGFVDASDADAAESEEDFY